MRNKKQSSSRVGALFLTLFALPFAGIGGFMGYLLVSCLVERVEMASWEEVPAEIIDARLEAHHGEDGTSYELTARYAYRFAGQEYVGERVALHGGADNLGSYHEDRYQELEEHRRTETLFTCFVNPGDPSEAVLYPELRTARLGLYALFFLVFGGFGFGLLFGIAWSARKVTREGELERKAPEEPWRWKEEWATGRVKCSGWGTFLGATIFASLWNLISLPVLFTVPGEVADGNTVALVALLFPAIGAILATWAIRCFIRWRKFGDSVFEMATVPGVIGGTLGGVVTTTAELEPEDGFRVSLQCQRKTTSGSGNSRSTHTRILWEDEHHLERALGSDDPGATAIPIYFEIPFECEESEERSASDEVKWILSVKAKVPGVDFAVEFEVPVFRTEESSPDFEKSEDPLAAYRAGSQGAVDPLAGSRIAVTDTGDGLELLYPAARTPGMALITTLMFMGWTGICLALWYSDAPILFFVVFAFFDVLIALGVASQWFQEVTVTVNRERIHTRTRYLIFSWESEHAAADVRGIEPEVGMQSNGKVWYRIRVQVSGRSSGLICGSGIRGKGLAEHLAGTMRDALGAREEESRQSDGRVEEPAPVETV